MTSKILPPLTLYTKLFSTNNNGRVTKPVFLLNIIVRNYKIVLKFNFFKRLK